MDAQKQSQAEPEPQLPKRQHVLPPAERRQSTALSPPSPKTEKDPGPSSTDGPAAEAGAFEVLGVSARIAKAAGGGRRTAPPEKSIAVPAPEENDGRKRRAQRHSANTVVSVWSSTITTPLSCSMRDRSATGALLEFQSIRQDGRITEFSVGAKLNLAFKTSQERTTVSCEVVRIDGCRCGIVFTGQFVTEVTKTRKNQNEPPAAEKASLAKSLKSKFSTSKSVS